MSRSGYVDGYDDDNLQMGRWRGMVASAIRGKRGQAIFKEMLAAMDAMPVKRLVANELEAPDLVPCSHWGLFEATGVCAIGTVGKARGVDMTKLDPENYDAVAATFDIAAPLAQEIVWMNDEAGPWKEAPEARFIRIRSWVARQIRAASPESPQVTEGARHD